MRRTLLILALALTLAPVAQAQANPVVKQLARTGLTQEDINIMVQTGGTLYANRRAAVGDDTIWSNPATGAHGMVEVTSVQGNCVGVDYRFRASDRKPLQTVASRRCLSDGRWVLTP